MKFDVVLRACSAVNAVNGGDRPFGMNKEELQVTCINSLFGSLAQAREHFGDIDTEVIVIADRISVKVADLLLDHGAVVVSAEESGNAPTLKAALEKVYASDGDVVYLMEDDYLHTPDCVTKMLSLYKNAPDIVWELSEAPFFSVPYDYPDRSLRIDPAVGRRVASPLYVDHKAGQHWIQVVSTTWTFAGHKSAWLRHRDGIDIMAHNVNDTGLSHTVYRHAALFAPIPGLASHCHVGTMSPVVDWEPIAEMFRNDIPQTV